MSDPQRPDGPDDESTPAVEGAEPPHLHEEHDEIDLGDEVPEVEARTDEPEPEPSVQPTVERDPIPDIPAATVVPATWHQPVAPPPVEEPMRKRRWPRRVVLGAVLVLGALYVGGYFLTGSRMPADASVGGVDVSGMSPSEARAAVEAGLAPRQDAEIVLTHDSKEFRVVPKDAGLALDVAKSVEQVGGQRSWNPSRMADLFFGSHPHDPALDVDDELLQSSIGSIGASVDTEVVEALITFPGGQPTAREPVAGNVVSRAAAAAAIKKAYLVSDRPIEVPTEVVEPAVDSQGLADAMTSIAEPAVSGPITINVGGAAVQLPVTAYAPALQVVVKDSVMTPVIDAKALAKPLTDSTTGIGTKAVDATVRVENGKPVVVPGKEGVGLQAEEMATLLVPALTKTGAERSVAIEAKVVQPSFTTADAEALKITERTGNFVTKFPYAEYRNINQSRAAELINGYIVKPGETFSFNDTVGERTVANGFVTGTVINGGVFREELGGGVSQVVTTTYNAAFFAGMDDVEHHPHAFYINRYPAGREATVYYGNLDLRFKNSTDYGVLIRAYVKKSTPGSQGEMHVEMYSTKTWDVEAGQSARRNFRSPGKVYDDSDKCVPQDPIQGFDIDIFRTFKQGGKTVKTEKVTAKYQAADHVICGKKPSDDGDDG